MTSLPLDMKKNPQMVKLLRESLLPSRHVPISRAPSKTRSSHTKYTTSSSASDHVTLEGFDEDSDNGASSRTTHRSRSFIKDHRAGAGITNVLYLADKCVHQLQKISNQLSRITARNDHLAKGEKISDPGQDYYPLVLGELAKEIMTISREAFVPAHRLCQSAIGLYLTEDFIRESRVIDCLDYFTEGRVRVPNQEAQIKTLERLQACVDRADESCRKFQPLLTSSFERQTISAQKRAEYEEMRNVLPNMQSSLKNLYSTANGCFHLFELLLYITPEQQVILAGFLNSLNSMEKSDLLEDIATLRRSVDHIHLLLEKLSWASYTVYRLASGKSVCPSPMDSGIDTPNDEAMSHSRRHLNAMLNQKILAQKAVGDENSRTGARSSERFKQKHVVRQACPSESQNSIPRKSVSRSKSGKSGKSNAAVPIQRSSTKTKKSKPKSKERLQEEQRVKSKSKDKKAGKKSKTATSKKFKRVEEAESQDTVEYYS